MNLFELANCFALLKEMVKEIKKGIIVGDNREWTAGI